jgi:hypothetical protein
VIAGWRSHTVGRVGWVGWAGSALLIWKVECS